MKDSQPRADKLFREDKYIKANNERFSTFYSLILPWWISISRRIMKDSQQGLRAKVESAKYIKANNERFSTSAACSRVSA